MEIKEELGCVYFIKLNGLTPIKIGWSTHPTPCGRVDSFAVGAPFGVELVGFIQSKKAKELETLLHKRFSSFRCSGEWFDISKEQARSCCEQYMDTVQKDQLSEAYTILSKRGSLVVKEKTPYPEDFIAWADVTIQYNIRLSKSELYNSFMETYTKYQLSISQRKFTMWIEHWANLSGMKYVYGKSSMRWVMIVNNVK
jgi:hypothetical protein